MRVEGEREDSDEELVAQAQEALRGDVRAFETLVTRYESRVVTNCRFLTGSPADAEDLAQEVFTKAFFGLRRFEGRSSFGTWVHRIKVNHCLNHIEKRSRRPDLEQPAPLDGANEEADPTPTAEHELIGRTEREQIEAALEALPDTLRIPLVLREIDGWSYQEIADELRVGLSAVKMRIKRAREAFRDSYARRTGGGGGVGAGAGER